MVYNASTHSHVTHSSTESLKCAKTSKSQLHATLKLRTPPTKSPEPFGYSTDHTHFPPDCQCYATGCNANASLLLTALGARALTYAFCT